MTLHLSARAPGVSSKLRWKFAARIVAVVFAILLTVANGARAQSTSWDAFLTDSQWAVPSENLLAYLALSSNFANPTAVADQTIWQITSSVDGIFTGTWWRMSISAASSPRPPRSFMA